MSKFDEKMLEDYIIKKLQEEKKWVFIAADQLERESYEEPLLTNTLVRKMKELNKDIAIGDEEIKYVLNELKFKGAGMEGAKRILNFYKFGIPVKFEKERVVKYVKLFDYENIDKNKFIISRQVVYHGKEDIRTDIILYINGIPLVDIELKNPASFSESWFDAYVQIKDYEKIVPELYKYIQIGVAAEQIAKYFPIVPWQEEVKSNEWREDPKDSIDAIIEMLSRDKLLDIIQNYIFFRIETGNATKVITRYMQYRASEEIINRVLNNLDGKEDKDKGLIWHWQGSGKTLTMIFAANKLYHKKKLENPSIFFIVDRIELEDQLYEEFGALDIVQPDIIGSIDDLRKILKHDEGKGKRGILITLIHKFRVEELEALYKELKQQSENRETILKRRNVIAFIDEGHRTQYGTMAAQMKRILNKAFFFALTGTPISKKGRDTYWEFSYPPEEKYLDKYFITDSQRDGFTVKIVYQPRLEKEVHLKKEMLDAFLEIESEELPEAIAEDIQEKVKKRLNIINAYLENKHRIEIVAKDIAQHFKENIDGKFKAMVVGCNRTACVYYKRFLDQHLPKEYSEVVMTYGRDDSKVIRDYLEELKKRFVGKEVEDIRKDIVEKFKEEEKPKILIVTDMLLTGFDAPVLQTMYLDKPLKEHRLLQAIARTNRPYKDVKEAGVIIDYVGTLTEFKRAFELYSKEEIKGALYDINDIRQEFSTLLHNLLSIFESIPKDNYSREVLLIAIEILTSEEEKSKEFLDQYKQLRKKFELLGPDEIKAERFSEYKWLSAIYTYYMRTVLRSRPSYEEYVQKYFNKTVKFIHESTELYNVQKELPSIHFDEQYLKNLEEKVKSREEKAANIVFTLNRLVLVDRHQNPVYETITEKADRLLKLWKEKTKDFEKIYNKGAEILKEIEKLNQRQRELGFSNLQYSLLMLLEKKFGDKKSLINDVKELSQILQPYTFSGWTYQSTARKKVEGDVRRFVRKYVKEYDINIEDMDALYQQLIANVMNYGKAG